MGVNIHTIKNIRLYLLKELEGIYEEPEIGSIINIIIKTVINVSRLHQLNYPDKPVSNEQYEKIINIGKELKTGKPLQYIMGETVFYDCVIKVNQATLIPRPETEELVDLVVRENRSFPCSIVDFGTGSGCIAIALASNIPGSKITGIDISEDALKIAYENALINNVSVSFHNLDLFNFEYQILDKADIIISNPPYVRYSEKLLMNKNVIDFEPPLALFVPDTDPLRFYLAILDAAKEVLKPAGKIYFEINEAMGASMKKLLESYKYDEIKIVKDINGKDRIIKGIKND